jgi:hypothetical protein
MTRMTREEAAEILDGRNIVDRAAYLEALEVAANALCESAALRADAPPPNGPLTMEELREMDGQPVWFCKCHNGLCNWCVIDHTNETNIFFTDGTVRLMSSYGDGWLAYRRRPEEGTV